MISPAADIRSSPRVAGDTAEVAPLPSQGYEGGRGVSDAKLTNLAKGRVE